MALALAGTAAAQRPERPALNITGYVIDAELDTADPPSRRQGGGDLYRAGKCRDGELRLSSRAQGDQDHRRRRQGAHRRALRRRHHSRDPATALRQGADLSLDLRVRRRDHRQRRRPRRRPEAGRHPGADHLPALRRALVPHHRLHDRPLHRGDAHPRAAGNARLRQRQHGRVASGHARRRQARRPVRLQLDQARISRHRDRRPLREPGRRSAPAT